MHLFEVIHRSPIGDDAEMPCCGKTPFEIPLYHRMTLNEKLVNCEPEDESDSIR